MPIPDEKARAWTRPEDYWPPRRFRRRSHAAKGAVTPTPLRGQPGEPPRPLLGVIPYFLLMIGLAVLAAAVIVVAWPGRVSSPPAATVAPPAEIGTAPKGWMPRQ